MNEQEIVVQKYVASFCKALPGHVTKCESLLQESVKPLSYLTNLAEQKRQVDCAKVKYYDNFENAQKFLQFEISNRIEEELFKLKEIIDKFSKLSNDLKNKLVTLERSSLSLDWDNPNNVLINGSSRQPSLSQLLQTGLEFVQFFSTRSKLISDRFKSLSFGKDSSVDKSLQKLKDAFKIDLNCNLITYFLALTQYVDNDKKIQ